MLISLVFIYPLRAICFYAMELPTSLLSNRLAKEMHFLSRIPFRYFRSLSRRLFHHLLSFSPFLPHDNCIFKHLSQQKSFSMKKKENKVAPQNHFSIYFSNKMSIDSRWRNWKTRTNKARCDNQRFFILCNSWQYICHVFFCFFFLLLPGGFRGKLEIYVAYWI